MLNTHFYKETYSLDRRMSPFTCTWHLCVVKKLFLMKPFIYDIDFGILRT